MIKHSDTKIIITVLMVLIVAFVPFMSAVASSYYFDYPGPNYTQSDIRVSLHTYGFSGPPYPVRVDWVAPGGANVSYCNAGGCGVSYDQQVADNGILVWRNFYFYISGQQRPAGTYTAIAYSYQNYVYTEMFRANFSISGTSGPTNTPSGPTSTSGPTVTPSPTYTPTPTFLDPTFGTGGKVTTSIGGIDVGYAVAVQADGKIVTAGKSDSAFALARYNSDGSLDAGFGTGGKVTTEFSGAGWNDQARAVALQDDSKIVLAGVSNWNFALARYNSDGSLDTGFGTGGEVTTDFGGSDDGFAVAVQADGKIVAAGTSDSDFALARYNSDGSLDAGFGTGGEVTTDFGANDGGYTVALQADGKIVVAGTTNNNGSNFDFALARYNSDGSLDTGFGTGGEATTDFGRGEEGYAVALQTDGKIVVAGSTYSDTGYSDFALARYNSNGSLDTGFGASGKVTTAFGYNNWGRAVALDAGGKIVVAGSADNGSNSNFALARYNSNGSLDTGFAIGGKVTTDFGANDEGRTVALQADGKIVVAGFSGSDFALARYIASEPTPTPTSTITGTPPTPTPTLTPSNTPIISLTPTPTDTPTPPTCNTGTITINDNAAASPYPSTITLAGLGTSITHVSIQLLGLTHAWPDDIDILLVGPQGQNLIVMSDAGGFDTLDNINLTLDDSAAQVLPDDTALASGAYRPADYQTGDTFPAPAPAPSSTTILATFNGTNPNGTWSLYIVDDEALLSGGLSGGWCLNVTAPTNTPTPTLQSALTSTPTQVVTSTPTGTTGTITPPSDPTPTPTGANPYYIFLPLVVR